MPLKFGLAIDFAHPERTLDQQVARYLPLLRAAERHGFDSVTLGEGYPAAPSWGHVPSPFLVLAALTSQTGLRLGTSVTLLPTWHPLKLAYDAAVLDQLSGGRFILGVAVGGAGVSQRFGREPGTLGAFIDDTLACLRALWNGAKGFEGRVVSVQGSMGVPPIRPNGPELWVGGALRRSAERAAEWGDGWCASTNYSFDRICQQVERYRTALSARGKALSDGIVSINRLTVVAESDEAARGLAAPYVGRVLQRYARQGALGSDPTLSARGPGELLDDFQASHCLLGTADAVVAQVARYAEAGVTQIQVRVSPDEMPIEAAVATVELLGKRVLSEFH
jgi:alkanesulfonate monooxygenase SsuD/methylene tetrahydromethanopterin reductase-like flavin-dependent oxidoreductase (luciferase family)